jgi:hypothetical protein
MTEALPTLENQEQLNQEIITAVGILGNEINSVKKQVTLLSLYSEYISNKLQEAGVDLALEDFQTWAEKRSDEIKAEALKHMETMREAAKLKEAEATSLDDLNFNE